MKKIEAFVQPHRLDEVTLAMHRTEGVSGMSVWEVRGWGHGKQLAAAQSHAEQISDFKPHIKVEIVCSDAQAQAVCEAIQQAAHTGLAGDGTIFISSIEEAIRISSGERTTDEI